MKSKKRYKINDFYDELWKKFEKQNYTDPDIGWKYEKRRIDSTILNLLEGLTRKRLSYRILEVGIGKGDLALKTSLIPGESNITYFGIDISKPGVAIARKRICNFKFHFLVSDGLNLPFKSQYFDLVICSEVLEHVIEKRKLIIEIGRVLKNGSHLVITTPNPKSLTYIIPRNLKQNYGSNQPINEPICPRILNSILHKCDFKIIHRSGLVLQPSILMSAQNLLRKPFVITRGICERLERVYPKHCLYQVILAIKE